MNDLRPMLLRLSRSDCLEVAKAGTEALITISKTDYRLALAAIEKAQSCQRTEAISWCRMILDLLPEPELRRIAAYIYRLLEASDSHR